MRSYIKSAIKEELNLFGLPIEEKEICVCCDKEKEVHSLCGDCLTSIVNENKTNT